MKRKTKKFIKKQLKKTAKRERLRGMDRNSFFCKEIEKQIKVIVELRGSINELRAQMRASPTNVLN